MNDVELIRTLEKAKSTVFSTQQLSVILGRNIASTRVKLNRLVNKGVLIRVIRGYYTLPSSYPLALASNIHAPSYVSLYSAFEYYGTTTQSPKIIDVINRVISKRISVSLDFGDFDIRFIKTTPSVMFGYKKINQNGKEIVIAEKEKSILDGLLFPGYVPIDEIYSCIVSGIDRKRIIEYAKKIKRQAVLKRLGYLLSHAGIECSFGDSVKLSDTYIPLDPSSSRRGVYDKKWRVIVNTVVE